MTTSNRSTEDIFYINIPILPVDPKIDERIEEYFRINAPKNVKKAKIRILNKRIQRWK